MSRSKLVLLDWAGVCSRSSLKSWGFEAMSMASSTETLSDVTISTSDWSNVRIP